MNQTLDGHQGAVLCVTWNANYRKLTTSDQNGLIIVWMLHKGVWFEEMVRSSCCSMSLTDLNSILQVNNRNKSVVRAMKWTADGQKICIVYDDGAVIVGSVDGNRLWGKDLASGLRDVAWSPDSSLILFVTSDYDVVVYDANGNKVRTLRQLSETNREEKGLSADDFDIIGIDWYDGMEGYIDASAPTLAIAYRGGFVQLMRGAEDIDPIVLRTELRLRQCKWNTRGSVIALAGSLSSSSSDQRDFSTVQFYSPHGIKLRAMRVPGGSINGLSWEGGGLRIALAVDSYIYFANICPDYKWAYFADTLLVAYSLPERSGTAVLFWNLKTNERVKKRATGLRAIKAAGDYCILVSAEPASNDPKKIIYRISLRNAVGSTVESRLSPIEPIIAAMTLSFAIVANERFVYVWQFARNSTTKKMQASLQGDADGSVSDLLSLRQSTGRERVLDVESASRDATVMIEAFKPPSDETGANVADKIVGVCASDRMLLVARASGVIFQYTLPHMVPEAQHQSPLLPWKMALNCDHTKLAIVDANGALGIMSLVSPGAESRADVDSLATGQSGTMFPFERKDAWDVLWAEDDPDLFVTMEKTRLFVYKNLQPEEPVACAGYLASFGRLKVTSIVVEEAIENPENAAISQVLVTNETKSLREVRDVLQSTGCAEAYTYVGARPHPYLWRCVAEAALESLDLAFADKAFVRCHDYQGIQFVKRLRALSDRMKQRAEVSAYFGKYDEADQIYQDIDRKDLAIQLRSQLGDWARVTQIIKSGAGDDDQLNSAWCKLGDQYALTFRWDRAREYYELAKDPEKLADCYYNLGDFEALEGLLNSVPEGSHILTDLGHKFESVGLHSAAADAYIRAGKSKPAIDCCILLNQWDRAIEIAEQFGFQQIEGLLVKYVTKLLNSDKKLLAVELYRKANKPTEAAKLLAKIAEEVGNKGANPVRAKKLHVLAALEVERYRKNTLDLTMTRVPGTNIAQTTAATLDTLMTHDQESGISGAKVLDNAWRGAAAYHYYLLAHRQLYAGEFDKAKYTGIRLAEYEDVIDRRDIYSLIALSALHAKDWHVCSRAFIKLETLENIRPEEQEQYEALAVNIFTEHPLNEPQKLASCYVQCLDFSTPYNACTVTGQAILDQRTILCSTCRHHAIEIELRGAKYCPLCHTPYPNMSL